MSKMASKKEQLAMEEMAQHARSATDLLKALGHESRLMILCQLATGEKSVSELEELCNMRQAGVSQHLARLRYDGIVDYRREGTSIFYWISSPEANHIINALYDMYCAKVR